MPKPQATKKCGMSITIHFRIFLTSELDGCKRN
jgi:hypothetical protein